MSDQREYTNKRLEEESATLQKALAEHSDECENYNKQYSKIRELVRARERVQKEIEYLTSEITKEENALKTQLVKIEKVMKTVAWHQRAVNILCRRLKTGDYGTEGDNEF